MNLIRTDSLKPLLFNGKGPIFTIFYAKELQALKVWAKLEKKLKGSSGIRTHNITMTTELQWIQSAQYFKRIYPKNGQIIREPAK